MKNVILLLLLTFSLPIAARQTVYEFDYDQSGNVVAVRPVVILTVSDNINVSENLDGGIAVSVSPNPTSGIIGVSINVVELETSPEIEIYSSSGETVYRTAVDGTETIIDISGVAEGIYFLKVTIVEKSATVKFLKS